MLHSWYIIMFILICSWLHSNAVWQSSRGCVYNGLQLPNVCPPSFWHCTEQLWWEIGLRMNSMTYFSVIIFDVLGCWQLQELYWPEQYFDSIQCETIWKQKLLVSSVLCTWKKNLQRGSTLVDALLLCFFTCCCFFFPYCLLWEIFFVVILLLHNMISIFRYMPF